MKALLFFSLLLCLSCSSKEGTFVCKETDVKVIKDSNQIYSPEVIETARAKMKGARYEINVVEDELITLESVNGEAKKEIYDLMHQDVYGLGEHNLGTNSMTIISLKRNRFDHITEITEMVVDRTSDYQVVTTSRFEMDSFLAWFI